MNPTSHLKLFSTPNVNFSPAPNVVYFAQGGGERETEAAEGKRMLRGKSEYTMQDKRAGQLYNIENDTSANENLNNGENLNFIYDSGGNGGMNQIQGGAEMNEA